MRQVIEGKVYDSAKAQFIGEADNLGHGVDSVSDFGYWTAGLYVTSKDQYFLAGEGGPMSRFAQPAGQNASRGGSGIFPLSKEKALEWAEQHLDAETVEQWFSDLIEDA